jgi:hypothetical protein
VADSCFVETKISVRKSTLDIIIRQDSCDKDGEAIEEYNW